MAIVARPSATSSSRVALAAASHSCGRQSRSTIVSARRPRATQQPVHRRPARLGSEGAGRHPQDRHRRRRIGVDVAGLDAQVGRRRLAVEDDARIVRRVHLGEGERRAQRRGGHRRTGCRRRTSRRAPSGRSRRTGRRRPWSARPCGDRAWPRRRRRWWPCRRPTCGTSARAGSARRAARRRGRRSPARSSTARAGRHPSTCGDRSLESCADSSCCSSFSSEPPAISPVSSSWLISSLAKLPSEWPRLRIRKRSPTG